MNPTTDPNWLNFDIHGLVGVRVHSSAPSARHLHAVMGSFAVDTQVPADIVVSGDLELMLDAALIGDELAHNASSVHFRRHHVQVVEDGTQYRVNGPGALLDAVLPVLDLALASREAAIIRAATVAYAGHAIVLPAAGGIGMAGTIGKLSKRPGFSFMGDAWGFVTADGRLLNFEKPMVVGPEDRATYPHLFPGSHKPIIPPQLAKPLDRFSTAVQPHAVRHPRLADVSRRMSSEHGTVMPRQALPGVNVTQEAPILMAAFVERYEGARTQVAARDSEWMVQRLLGNFHLELPRFSRELLAGLAATSHLAPGSFFDEKAGVLGGALADIPSFVLQIPSVYSPGIFSEEVPRVVGDLLRTLVAEGKAPSGVSVA